MSDLKNDENRAPSRRSAPILFFLLLLYAGCFILFYGLAYAFYALLAGPNVFASAAPCVAPVAGSRTGSVCETLVALHAKFMSPWFFGGLIVTIITLVIWRLRSKQFGQRPQLLGKP